MMVKVSRMFTLRFQCSFKSSSPFGAKNSLFPSLGNLAASGLILSSICERKLRRTSNIECFPVIFPDSREHRQGLI